MNLMNISRSPSTSTLEPRCITPESATASTTNHRPQLRAAVAHVAGSDDEFSLASLGEPLSQQEPNQHHPRSGKRYEQAAGARE
ncbi:hypothetical protein BDW67DRAFT_165108 [Aspergillus spinulosporus]